MARRKLIVIEDNLAAKLLTRPQYRDIPEISALARRVPDMPTCCAGNHTEAARVVFNTIKHAVASLSAASQSKLKRLLNTDAVRVVYKLGAAVHSVSF